VAWTESRKTADRQVSNHPRLQRFRADEQGPPSEPGIIIDTEDNGGVLGQWPVRKHRKRVMPDIQTDYRSGLTIERIREFPRRGKARRRQYVSSYRKHRQTGIEQGRRRRVSSKHGYTAESRSANLPVDVAIRLIGSQQRRSRRRHSHRRHRHRSKARRVRASRMQSGVNRRQRRRRTSERDASDFSRRSATAKSLQHSLTTLSDDVSSTSSSSGVKLTPTDLLPPVHRTRRSQSTAHSRVPRDMDKKRQRLILEKLLESSMSEAERNARKLTAARLDELLGKGMQYYHSAQHTRLLMYVPVLCCKLS